MASLYAAVERVRKILFQGLLRMITFWECTQEAGMAGSSRNLAFSAWSQSSQQVGLSNGWQGKRKVLQSGRLKTLAACESVSTQAFLLANPKGDLRKGPHETQSRRLSVKDRLHAAATYLVLKFQSRTARFRLGQLA